MTVSSTTSKSGPYAGSGTTGPFVVGFRFLADSHLLVIKTSTANADTTLTISTDYTVSGAGAPTGTVTLTTALAVGEKLTIIRNVPATQEVDYVQNDSFPAESHEQALDKLTMISQQVSESMGRSIRIPASDGFNPRELPAAASRALSLLGFDSGGDVIAVVPSSGSAADVLIQLADSTDALKGGGLSGFNWALAYAANTIGWGVRSGAGMANALRYVPVAEWAAILAGTSTYDATAALQAFVDAGGGFVPRGRWNVSATVGVGLRHGTQIVGAGRNNTIFLAILGTGGTQAQLVNYTAGSVFRRASWSTVGPNDRVSNVYLANFAVVLNHPTAAITATAIQIGIDMRNITRSEIERVHCGNYAPEGSFVTKADPPSGFAQQGYCFVHGNVSSGGGAYAGGEVHVLRDGAAWGAFKGIVQDDATLSPLSAAHGVSILECDIQGCHHSLVQELQYSTGIAWRNNKIQNIIKQNGSATTSYGMRMAGYNNDISGSLYGELGGGADYALRLEGTSCGNNVTLGYFSASAGALVSDVGTENAVTYRASTAVLPAVNSAGPLIQLYNKAYRWGRAKATIAAGVVTMVESVGEATVSIITDPGRLALTLARPMPSANWHCTATVEYAGRAAGSYTAIFGSQTTSVFHIDTFLLAGSAATNPTTVSFEFFQR